MMYTIIVSRIDADKCCVFPLKNCCEFAELKVNL